MVYSRFVHHECVDQLPARTHAADVAAVEYYLSLDSMSPVEEAMLGEALSKLQGRPASSSGS